MNRSWLSQNLFHATGKQSIHIAASPWLRALRIGVVLVMGLALCGFLYRSHKHTNSKNHPIAAEHTESSFNDSMIFSDIPQSPDATPLAPQSLLWQPALPGSEPLQAEPAQLAPFPAASSIRLLGFRRKSGTVTEEVSSWEFSSVTADAVVTHYENAAKQAKFSQINHSTTQPNADHVSLGFTRSAPTTRPADSANVSANQQWLIIRIAPLKSNPSTVRATIWLRCDKGDERLR